MAQAGDSSNAIVSSGGGHDKRASRPSKVPMAEIKRPRGRQITNILPVVGSVECTVGCPGCMGQGYYHNAHCLRQRAHLTLEVSAKLGLKGK